MERLEEVVVGQKFDPFKALVNDASFWLASFKLIYNLGDLTKHPVEDGVFTDFEVGETLAQNSDHASCDQILRIVA